MEDFVHILQRDYGLKPVGKAAPMGSGASASAGSRAGATLDKGKSSSGGSGAGRNNRAAAAAAVFAAGEDIEAYSRGSNGMSKPRRRHADPAMAFGSSPDDIIRGPANSAGGLDEGFGRPNSGSSSGSSFGDLLGGGSLGQPAGKSSFNEELPSGSSQNRSRPVAPATLSTDDQEGPRGRAGRRSARSGDSRRSVEDEFLGSIAGEPKSGGGQAGTSPSSFDGDLQDGLKPGSRSTGAESQNPLEGSFMRGFGQSSRAGRSSTSTPTRTKLNVESSNHNTTGSAASSLSMDDPFLSRAEAASIGGVDSTAGFTVPASEASAFPDSNVPYTVPRVSTRRRSHLKISSSEVESGEPQSDAVDGGLRRPPPPTATAEAKESSSPGTPALVPGSRVSSRGRGNDEGRAARKAYPNSPFVLDSPASSPSYTTRPRRNKVTEMYSNGSSPGMDDPVTSFEVNMATREGAQRNGDSHRAQKRSEPTGEVWLTVHEVRLVTQPSASPHPSRAPPQPGLARQYSGADRQQSGPETQHADLERQGSGSERQPAGVEGSAEGQQQRPDGFVLPEVTIVDLGPQLKPSREERRRIREQLEMQRRRASGEEERPKERERGRERESLRESLYREAEAAGRSRDTPRSREGRGEKVVPMGEPQTVEAAVTRKEQKDSQDQVLRQQEKDFQERMARREEVRDRENKRVAHKAKRSAEKKAALEAQERAEQDAVDRAREWAESATQRTTAAAKEQERAKEREREREREKERREKEKEMEKERELDREQEKLRDRMREREKGVAEQLRRDVFRATSEPRQRPSVAVTQRPGLSRHSSGINFSNASVAAAAPVQQKASVAQKVVDDWTNLFTQPSVAAAADFREIPGEPADRRKLRLEKQMLIEERAAKALQEKNQRDQALQQEQEERQRFAGNLDAEVRRWSMGKEGNLRALLSSLHLMLWPECNWKVVSLSDLITGPSVKKAYQKAILCVHPDKVQQKGANVQQKYIAEKVFDLLKDAYAKFNANELY